MTSPSQVDATQQVKARLLPPPRWKALIEACLERLPRRQFIPRLQPLSQLVAVPGGPGRWRSTGDDPAFVLAFDHDEIPTGWVYLECALQRSMGNRLARLYVDRGQGFMAAEGMFVPSNLRGSVRELIFIPSDAVALRWDPCEARGFFTQSPLVFTQIGGLERTVRMADRLATHRGLLRGGKTRGARSIGGHWDPLIDAYLEIRRRRMALAVPKYEHYIQSEASAPGRQRVDHILRQPRRRAPPKFLIHIGLYGETAARWEDTLASLERQKAGDWAIVDWRRHDAVMPDAESSQDWHLRLRAGDILPAQALETFSQIVQRLPEALVVYSDHDFIGADHLRHSPVFKPDWDLDLFLTHNYLANLCAVSGAVMGATGTTCGRPTDEVFQGWILQASRQSASSIVHLPVILCHRQPLAEGEEPYGGEAPSVAALSRYLAASGASLAPGTCLRSLQVRWPLPSPAPQVTVIIPTRDRVDLLRTCVDSVLARTDYPHYDVCIVDNDSETSEAAAYFSAIVRHERVRVLRHPGPFNFSAINNVAASVATGSLLVFLNNDTEVIDAGWMTHLARQAVRPEVGAVGAKLLYSDATVQHAGVVMGIGGVAGHVHRFLSGHEPGYVGRAELAHHFSAVTAACLMVRKQTFEAVGGFNAEHLVVAFNDVDLCLKLRDLGLVNLFEPRALLYHHESMSRGLDDTDAKREVFRRERDYMLRQWANIISDDPAYNPNLTREQEDFSFRAPTSFWS